MTRRKKYVFGVSLMAAATEVMILFPPHFLVLMAANIMLLVGGFMVRFP